MTKSFDETGGIAVGPGGPILTYSPVRIDVPGRPVPLEVKVSMPVEGDRLPVIVLSHGHGVTTFLSSLRGYAPLADFWAAHGFVVLQPTHLDSTALGLRDEPRPDSPLFWRDRATDLHTVLDHLDHIESNVPGLAGRLDHERVAAVGHSLGGGTVGLVLGMRVLDPTDPRPKDLSDPRIAAGVLIGAPGVGDDHLSPWAAATYPMMRHIDFAAMSCPALVVAGDQDLNLNFSDRLSYRWDAYTRSPGGNKTLLTLIGAEHLFGGISGYDASETTDDDPDRMALLRALIWAYLRTRLYPDDPAWPDAVRALEARDPAVATIEER